MHVVSKHQLLIKASNYAVHFFPNLCNILCMKSPEKKKSTIHFKLLTERMNKEQIYTYMRTYTHFVLLKNYNYTKHSNIYLIY